ncbi:spermidine/putrescine transport system permease protein [Sporobacter termitidis DSM 10068]|uniref:Spermidine/putrescine transport system permease protein n=1 Tax=Sporobacter termitidis DSM 10068 TaxID=1123282 RepID=A0A1M5XEV1_9FIRM|nr:ABC transporter permease [Sporobacter termitidis]SHH98279.1 spermidine/putrescine transport system permease protein [Sporobacter termitidis DSM 10068]
MKKLTRRGRVIPALVTVSPVTLWMVLLIGLPLLYVLFLSFMTTDGYSVVFQFNLLNYAKLFDPTYMKIYLNSFIIAFLTTVFCVLLGYPFAYKMARAGGRKKVLMMAFLMIPFWTNSLIRLYGWRTLLAKTGVVNSVLQAVGLIGQPVEFMYTRGAVLLGMVYILFPFMVLPLYAAIEKLDWSLLEASSDLGARRARTFAKVTLPLTSSGIFAGAIMVFIPTLGIFFVSDIMGGGSQQLIGNLIQTQFNAGNNWPLGSALSIGLIVLTLLLVGVYRVSGGKMEDLV